jgi:hypothetical protein
LYSAVGGLRYRLLGVQSSLHRAEKLIHTALLQVFYSIRSERQLME